MKKRLTKKDLKFFREYGIRSFLLMDGELRERDSSDQFWIMRDGNIGVVDMHAVPAAEEWFTAERYGVIGDAGPEVLPQLYDYADLEELIIMRGKKFVVPPGLSRLKQLRTLYIESGSIDLIPEISSLPRLTTLGLNLNAGQLKFLITQGVLQQLSALIVLNDQLGSLPPEIGQLVNLSRLSLGNCGLSSLPAEIGNLINLTELDLTSNPLSGLPSEVRQLVNLASLDLSACNLTHPFSEFEKIPNLTRLNFSNNDFSELFMSGESWHLPNLISLDLSNCGLSEFPIEITSLSRLAELNLSGNTIAFLPPEISLLSNLTTLRLGGVVFGKARLDSLPPEIGGLVNLTELELSNNRLTSLPPEIGRLTKLVKFDLVGNELDELPAEIGSLTSLTSLNLSDNNLVDLPPTIGQLVCLKSLILSENQLVNLPVEIGRLNELAFLTLRDNKLPNLPVEIGGLVGLIELDLSGNELNGLPAEIGHLHCLASLDLSENLLTHLPAEIKYLSSLVYLDLSFNWIADLPPEIWQLSNLSVLYLYGNPLNHLPADIGKLLNLEELVLSSTSETIVLDNGLKIKELPAEILNLKKLKKLDLRDIGLDFPPEILDNTDDPNVILNYFAWVLEGRRRAICETKMLVVGQGSVGKTSLIKRLVSASFDSYEPKTDGIAIEHWKVENRTQVESEPYEIALHIWDFGGQEVMHATHQFFLTKRSLYLLVLDSRLAQEENRVEYWLKIIQSFGGESPVLIVGNKIDQHPLDIDRTGLQKKYPNIVGILETSAATGTGIEELKAAITEQVNNLPHVRDLLPETWFIVKTKLEELGKQSNFITHDKYLDLCAENEVSDETSQRTLIGFLHDLGVVLHFQDDPRLEALGILNPQWVTNGVYKILNSHTLFQNKGVLTTSMLDEILNLPEYPRGKRLFIVDMMKKFELCYDIPYGYDVEPDKTFLVPDLLPKDQPDLTFNGVPAFEYAYPVLPSSVITRFIVRMNQKIDDGFVWRTGVVLRIGDNKALVKADIEDRKITIAIDGLEHTRRDALSAIRYQLDEIHASIKGLNPEKRVPIPEAPNAAPLEYDYLLQLERDGFYELPVKDGNRLVKVDVRKLLSGVVSEAERRQSGGNITNIYIGGDVSGNVIAGDENEVKQ